MSKTMDIDHEGGAGDTGAATATVGPSAKATAGARAGRAAAAAAQMPWVEKYRPRTINDVAHQEEVCAALRSSISSGVLPHLLFYGPPGTGKTSTILALCRELYGPLMKSRVLELNASDERGISVVRNQIKSFAQTSVGRTTHAGYPCPPFKIIILDEADSMTDEAQAALRRTIERYSNVTRFCMICNYVSRIIDPLASRCAKFRFKPLPRPAMERRLDQVASQEGIAIDESSRDALLRCSKGDMRRAITLMQSASQLYGAAGTPLAADAVVQVAGELPGSVAAQFWEAAHSGTFANVQREVDELSAQGFAATAVLQSMMQDTLATDRMNETQKAEVLLALGEADKCLTDGADEHLQMLNVGGRILKALKAP